MHWKMFFALLFTFPTVADAQMECPTQLRSGVSAGSLSFTITGEPSSNPFVSARESFNVFTRSTDRSGQIQYGTRVPSQRWGWDQSRHPQDSNYLTLASANGDTSGTVQGLGDVGSMTVFASVDADTRPGGAYQDVAANATVAAEWEYYHSAATQPIIGLCNASALSRSQNGVLHRRVIDPVWVELTDTNTNSFAGYSRLFRSTLELALSAGVDSRIDFEGDEDFELLLDGFGLSSDAPLLGDATQDLRIDLSDFAIYRQFYGQPQSGLNNGDVEVAWSVDNSNNVMVTIDRAMDQIGYWNLELGDPNFPILGPVGNEIPYSEIRVEFNGTTRMPTITAGTGILSSAGLRAVGNNGIEVNLGNALSSNGLISGGRLPAALEVQLPFDTSRIPWNDSLVATGGVIELTASDVAFESTTLLFNPFTPNIEWNGEEGSVWDDSTDTNWTPIPLAPFGMVPNAESLVLVAKNAPEHAIITDVVPDINGLMISSFLDIQPGGLLNVVAPSNSGGTTLINPTGELRLSSDATSAGIFETQSLQSSGRITLEQRAQLSVDGNFENTGTLAVEVAKGIKDPQLQINGTAALGGTIQLLTDMPTLTLGDTFVVLSATGAILNNGPSVKLPSSAQLERGTGPRLKTSNGEASVTISNIPILQVDQSTGSALMTNVVGDPLLITGYAITSDMVELNPDWNGLSEIQAGWEVAGSPNNFAAIAELSLTEHLRLEVGSNIELENLFDSLGSKGFSASDFTFEVSLVDGSVLAGAVELTGRPPCDSLGDLDGNGVVGLGDFLIFSRNYGTIVSSPFEGDVDCNGTVAFPDFLILSANYGQSVATLTASTPQTATVPEPSAALLMVTACGVLCCWRRVNDQPTAQDLGSAA